MQLRCLPLDAFYRDDLGVQVSKILALQALLLTEQVEPLQLFAQRPGLLRLFGIALGQMIANGNQRLRVSLHVFSQPVEHLSRFDQF